MMSAEKKDPAVEEVSIHGDILESILSHVPLIDLIPACHVSKSWNRAVFSSLRRVKAIKPWLIIYAHSKRPPYATTAIRAYDPRSDLWINFKLLFRMEHVSPVRSSHSKILYTLSTSEFSFSVDPLHLAWRRVKAPRVSRTDPIVAIVGHRVVVAGGTCDFEDDALAVEMLDINTGTWETCQSMPALLKDSAASTWLSVAANSEKMYVTEKRSGTAYSLDLNTKSWIGPFDLRVDNREVYSRAIGFLHDRLIMAGITGDDEDPKGIDVWEFTGEYLSRFKLIGSMPNVCFDKLKGEDCACSPLTSITLSSENDMVYITNLAEAGEMVAAEMVDGRLCNWKSLTNKEATEKSPVEERLVLTCSDVRLSDLRRALREENRSFTVTYNL